MSQTPSGWNSIRTRPHGPDAGVPRGSATAPGGVERGVRGFFRDEDGVGVGGAPGRRADVAAGLDDAVERRAIDDEIPDHREGARTPWLQGERIAVLEEPHVELADGGVTARA